MNRDEYIRQAESRRRRRELELLAFLVRVINYALIESVSAFRHGLDYRVVLENRLLGNSNARMSGALLAIQETLERTHRSGMNLAADKLDEVLREVTLAGLYVDQSNEFVNAMLAAIKQCFWQGIGSGTDLRDSVRKIRAELEAAGYLRDNPFAIVNGIERQVVSAFNNGIFHAAYTLVSDEKAIAFQHITIMDGRETTICHERNLLTLPIDDEYWLLNFAPLHWGCRSLINPTRTQDYSTSLPMIPPMPGFGIMPASIRAFVAAQKRAA